MAAQLPPSAAVSPRARILARVRAAPGVHLREVARGASVPLATTLYHLDRLEAEGLVRSERVGRTRRFHPAGPAVPAPPRAAEDLVRRAMARRLVLAVAARAGATQAQLRASTGASRGSLSSHLTNLVRQGALVETTAGRAKAYALSSPDVLRAALAGAAR